MNNGFITPVVNWLIHCLQYMSVVEHFKNLAVWCNRKLRKDDITSDEIRDVKNIAIDIFIVAKWVFIIAVIALEINRPAIKYIVVYLIAANLFTYFFHHVWQNGFSKRSDIESQRRRFVSFVLSLGFYLVCYAYLYEFHYASEIMWPDNVIDTTNAVFLSIANAFTLTYGGFAPETQTVRVIFATELINTFFFFVIIVVNSIPNLQE